LVGGRLSGLPPIFSDAVAISPGLDNSTPRYGWLTTVVAQPVFAVAIHDAESLYLN